VQLENTFTVTAPLAAVWAALQNPKVVAPCFPGASLTECDGDSFIGDVKLKVGPITMNYQGKGTYIERNETSHTIVIDARGRDARGQGTAAAKVTGSLKALAEDQTEVTMVADVAITGRAAQFGRAVIVEIADRIVAQFAQRLARTLSVGGTTDLPSSAALPAVEADDSDSLNLMTIAVLPGLKRALPTIATIARLGLLTAILVELRRIGRRR
jgi:carbon monoxide dehydrogenase subunit G